MDADLLSHALRRIDDMLAENPAWGATSKLDRPRQGQFPLSMSWLVEDENRMAQVVMWETGESETDLADSDTGEVRTESRFLSGTPDVDDRLNSIRSWLLSA